LGIKILRITTEINRSSIGRTTEQIGRLVINEGWKSYIAYGRTGGKSESNIIRIGNRLSVYWHVFLTRFFDMHGYGSVRATKSFIKRINKIRPNIIHLHDIHGYYINLKILFKYLSESKIPVVWTQHDCWAFTGHCTHYTEAKCFKWRSECNNCPQKFAYPKSFLMDGSRRNFYLKKKLFSSINNLVVVAVSDWMREQISESFLNRYPTIRIYNGIDTEVFKPMPECQKEIKDKYKLGNTIVLMAFATAWGTRKGLNDFYKLRKELGEKYTIVLVGLPKSAQAQLPVGIVGIERTDNLEELVKLYSAASIILNLSSEESFGKTTPEGLACGIPGIVYNSTASPELINEHTGRVVCKGDIKGIVNAINDILSWDGEETMLNCRKRACQLFHKDKNLSQYISLYKSILKN
jgi:glycosyltransferase involved in cell wall biosynthesis